MGFGIDNELHHIKQSKDDQAPTYSQGRVPIVASFGESAVFVTPTEHLYREYAEQQHNWDCASKPDSVSVVAIDIALFRGYYST